MTHERLESYQQLLQTAGDLAKRMTKWPRGYGDLTDQLRRAITSAVLNVSEGNGRRTSQKERRRFFEIALGSIAEVAAGLDLAGAFGLLEPPEKDALKSRLKLAYAKIDALP
jgi:four helix bundle protein